MMYREAHAEGVINDLDEGPCAWPKLTATALVLLKAELEKLIVLKTGQRVSLSDDEATSAFYNFTQSTGFPEILQRAEKHYVLVPFTGNAFLYSKHSKGSNYYARMYKRGAEYITVVKYLGDFYEVQDSINRIRVSDAKLCPLA